MEGGASAAVGAGIGEGKDYAYLLDGSTSEMEPGRDHEQHHQQQQQQFSSGEMNQIDYDQSEILRQLEELEREEAQAITAAQNDESLYGTQSTTFTLNETEQRGVYNTKVCVYYLGPHDSSITANTVVRTGSYTFDVFINNSTTFADMMLALSKVTNFERVALSVKYRGRIMDPGVLCYELLQGGETLTVPMRATGQSTACCLIQ